MTDGYNVHTNASHRRSHRQAVYIPSGETSKIDYLDWCEADRERYGKAPLVPEKGWFTDDGCEASPTCVTCPLVVCVEDVARGVNSVGRRAYAKAVQATASAGLPVPPHMEKYLGATNTRQVAGLYARVTDQERREWAELHRSGVSYSQIARLAGRRQQTVYQALKRTKA